MGQCPYVIALSLSFLFFPENTKFCPQIPHYLSILISQPIPYSTPACQGRGQTFRFDEQIETPSHLPSFKTPSSSVQSTFPHSSPFLSYPFKHSKYLTALDYSCHVYQCYFFSELTGHTYTLACHQAYLYSA